MTAPSHNNVSPSGALYREALASLAMLRGSTPRTHPLRLSPRLASALDAMAAELSARSLGGVSRAQLARALLALAVVRWGQGERPSPGELARALATLGAEPEGQGQARAA